MQILQGCIFTALSTGTISSPAVVILNQVGVNKGHGLINALLVTYLRRKLCLQTLTVQPASGTPQHECLKRPSRQKQIRDTPPARPTAALGEEEGGKKAQI